MYRGTGGIQTHCRWLLRYCREQGVACAYVSSWSGFLPWAYAVFAWRHACACISARAGLRWFRYWHHIGLVKSLCAAYARSPWDVLDAKDPLAAAAALEMRACVHGRFPVVITHQINTSQADEEIGKGVVSANDPLVQRIRAHEMRAYAAADAVVSVSVQGRETLVRTHAVRDAPNIAVIYNGVGAPPSVAAHSPFRLVSAGSLEARKNHTLLIDALSRIQRTHPQATLDILGEGPLRRSLNFRARELGCAQRVRIIGNCADAAAAYACYGIYLHAAREENCPHALLEALAVGIPVVACDAIGVREIVDCENGFLVEQDDAAAISECVCRLCDDAGLYARMSAAARASYEKRFTYQLMGAQYVRLYRQLTSPR
jgi:glycosyltransferase involved in cell wall biosynthesis